MTEILNGLIVSEGTITTEVINESFSVELSGKIKLTRGNLSQERSYYGRTYKTRYVGYVGVEDINGDEYPLMLGVVRIDSLDKLKKSLTDAGLSTLANKIVGFSYDEFKQAVMETMQTHKMFLAAFGKKAKIWDLLSYDERTKIMLQFTIDNYDNALLVSDNEKRSYGIVITDAEGNEDKTAIPTKEQLIEKLATL